MQVKLGICFFFPVLMAFQPLTYGQSTIEKYIQEGIAHHDNGDYEEAIAAYRHALYLNEKSALAHYEIALTFSYMQLPDSALAHANRVIELDGEHLLPAFIIKGNSLDALGKGNEAIKTYELAIKKLGGHYLLYYNYAVTAQAMGDTEKATELLITGISSYPAHPSSHLLLGTILKSSNQKAQSLMCLYYFLLLEPQSARSKTGFAQIKEQLQDGAARTGANEISVILGETPSKSNEFSSVDMMLSLMSASAITGKSEGKSEETIFFEQTESFFKILGELKKKKNKGVWWEFYVPFFYELAKSNHLTAYCHYIAQSSSEVSAQWMQDHTEALEAMAQWMESQ